MDNLNDLKAQKETIWLNELLVSTEPMSMINGEKYLKVKAAQNRFMRFMPFFESAFADTAPRKGIIESELLTAEMLSRKLTDNGHDIPGTILIKNDAYLPVSGSVKARGGIHEVLRITEALGQRAKILRPTDNYEKLNTAEYRDFYSKYTIRVGSTGNLGLSIGICGSALGFNVIVYMSSDAKEWKKELLRDNNVTVIECDGNYRDALTKGRKESAEDDNSIFIDDENSEGLFMGYATAALRLKIQLVKHGVTVDENHPLFIYLPCGVGGAPGGITYGLKQIFGDNAHCFFVEPVGAPCMTYALAEKAEMGEKNEKYKVKDISALDITEGTIADGLNVSKASEYALRMTDGIVSGSLTVSDGHLIDCMKMIYDSERLFLEPSACAGLQALINLWDSEAGNEYAQMYVNEGTLNEATHIIWATGGGLVPQSERDRLLKMT